MPISKKNFINQDKRGTLHECMNIGGDSQDVPSGGHLYAFSIEPNFSRGNHFHKIKEEWFMCLSGTVKVKLKNEQTSIETDIILKGMDGFLLHIPKMVRHTLINNSSIIAIMISYGSKVHNKDFPDTYF